MITPDTIPAFSPLHRMQWEESQQRSVILYPEGMVELNQSSAEILKRCDGQTRVAQLIDDLEAAFETTGLANDITTFLSIAHQNGWIQLH
jgi:pyrroloquinoline quinone biosynthesis protein D